MRLQDSLLLIHRHYKLIIGVAVLLLIIGVIAAGASDGSDKVDASTYNEKYFMCIDVEADDTLWSIAEEYISEEYSSIDEYIAEIKSINNLTSDKIYSGATLVIPYYAPPV